MNTHAPRKTNSHGRLPSVVTSPPKFPIRGKKKKCKDDEHIPRRAKTARRSSKFTGSLQENILTLLCFDPEACPIIIAAVDTSLFESQVYRNIADRSISYFQKYGEAAGDHLPDLVEDFLQSNKRSEVRMYTEALHALHSISKSINSKYILDELGRFVREQSLRQIIVNAAEEFQQGKTDSAVRLLAKGLDEIGRPQSAGLLNLEGAVHTYREFRKLEFPPVESALFPVLDKPGITQINGFRGHGKTFVALYMAVGLASGVDVFGWSCQQPHRVLFVDGELPPWTPQQRLKGVVADLGGVRPKMVRDNLHVISSYEGLLTAPINLSDSRQIDELVECFSQYDVVFLDSITALTFDIDMNDAQDWEVINTLSMRCRGNGTSIVRLQHLGKDKSKGGFGSSRQEHPLDFCLEVKQEIPTTFHANEIIHITCTKTRNHGITDFKPVDLELSKGRDGQIEITHGLAYKNKTEAMLPEIMELMTKNEWKNTNKQNFADKYDAERTTVYRAEQTARERIEQQEEENSLIN
ncbi:MAG: AAA family ATPase, partial [Proteobacteria bacterium]|nr:AAA family ATPase [Pseudomonadota bacterium]